MALLFASHYAQARSTYISSIDCTFPYSSASNKASQCIIHTIIVVVKLEIPDISFIMKNLMGVKLHFVLISNNGEIDQVNVYFPTPVFPPRTVTVCCRKPIYVKGA